MAACRVMLQWRYEMENVLFVPPESFDPPPRVDSAVVRMVPRAQPAAVDEKLLSELVQVAFSQRRKILRHTLGKWLEQKDFGGAFDTQRRAEEVPVDEYLALAQAVPAVKSPSHDGLLFGNTADRPQARPLDPGVRPEIDSLSHAAASQ